MPNADFLLERPSLRAARGAWRRAAIPALLPLLLAVVGACKHAPAVTTTPAAGVQPGTPAHTERTEKTQDPADKSASTPMPVDPAVRLGVLDNGLRYYVRQHGKPEGRVALRLAVNVGSVLEEDDQRGFAHFVEHMAFNGTRLFKKQALVDYLERVGMQFGSDVNASTSFDETIYTFTVPSDPATLAKGLLILQQIAAEVSFEPDEVSSERAVVLEERRLGLGASMRVLEQMMPVLFAGSRYASRMPIGTPQILERATAESLRAFYQRWYRPDLMAVAVVGDFDPVAVEQEVTKTFAAIAKPQTPLQRPTFTAPRQRETRVTIAQDAELPSTMVGVLHTIPRRPDASEGDYRRHIVEGLYHQMLNARLEELTRSASPPFLFAVSTTQSLVRPVEMLGQLAGVKQDGITPGFEALMREVLRAERHGFTAGELERAKREQLRRMQSLATEQPNLPSESFADEMVRHFLTGEAMPGIAAELQLWERYLPTITADEMTALARNWLGDADRVLLVQAPKNVTVPTRDQLLGLSAEVARQPVPAYVDRVAKGPLLARAPAPGRIVERKRVDDLGITEWRLSNGVRVLIKPTEWKRDEVLLAAYSPGGTSLLGERDYVTGTFAADLISSSGLGGMDPTELHNALAGTIAEVSPSIDELSEVVVGRASPRDLETMLQLLYLTFTAPRADERVFAAFKAQLGERLAHRDVDPESLFSDRLKDVLFAHHPRRRALEKGDENKLSLERALAIYRQRFANAADFTFVIVGSVTPEQLEPLLQSYLASLPSKPGRHEKWRDVGAWPIKGVRNVDVRKGVEPKSEVALTFTGPSHWTREEDYHLDALVAALGIRLREVVRERLGGTYGVDAQGILQRQPHEAYRVDVRFGCAPEKVDELVKAVFREIDDAKNGSLGIDYLEKVKAADRRSFEEATRTNGFWLGGMLEHVRYGDDLHQFLQRPKLTDALTTKDLEAAARRYLNETRYLLGVLRPEQSAAAAR